MARVNAPLMSLDASGTLAKAIVFSKWKGRPYVRTRVIPANPKSALQTGMRSGLAGAPPLWQGMSDAEKLAWKTAVGGEAISGYNLFCREGQQNLRNDFAYSKAPAGAREGTPTAPTTGAATQKGQDMEITWTDGAAGSPYTVLVFHSLTETFTPGIANLIAVVKMGVQKFLHKLPGTGTHYYNLIHGGEDGGVGAAGTEFSGTIT